jgi:hypothetical protein
MAPEILGNLGSRTTAEEGIKNNVARAAARSDAWLNKRSRECGEVGILVARYSNLPNTTSVALLYVVG